MNVYPVKFQGTAKRISLGDERFGDDWPGRIPAQLVAHTLFYFTNPGDLVFDPMAGGCVVSVEQLGESTL